MAIDDRNPAHIRSLHTRSRAVRDMDQLIGMCGGVMADGHLSELEAVTLQRWIRDHYELRDAWPANILLARLDAALADGKLESDEERDLLKTLMDMTGVGREAGANSQVSRLPLNDPPPPVEFTAKSFVVTGEFAFGPRKAVKDAIESRGGSVKSAPSGKTDYVVIGGLGSDEWKHGGFGTKIETAVDLRSKGAPIAIVSEEHWFIHL